MAFYRCKAFGHLEGGEIFNFGIHVEAVTGQAAVISIDFASAVTDLWSGTNTPAGNITALYAPSIGVDGVQVDELDDLGKNVSQGRTSLALVGTGTGEPLPPQNAIAVSLRTDLPTRAGRGRFFLPSPVVSTVLDQRLDSTAQTDILNGSLALLQDMAGHGWTPVVYHRANNRTTFVGTGDTIVSVDVGDVFDNQRRRRNKLVETRVSHNV